MKSTTSVASSLPSDDAFDASKNIAMRKFLKQFHKKKANNRRQTASLELGMSAGTVLINPSTQNPYKILLSTAKGGSLNNPKLVEKLSQTFDLSITTGYEDTLSLMRTASFDIVLAVLALEERVSHLLKSLHASDDKTPTIVLTPPSNAMDATYESELAACLEAGALGYFNQDLSLRTLMDRLASQVKYLGQTKVVETEHQKSRAKDHLSHLVYQSVIQTRVSEEAELNTPNQCVSDHEKSMIEGAVNADLKVGILDENKNVVDIQRTSSENNNLRRRRRQSSMILSRPHSAIGHGLLSATVVPESLATFQSILKEHEDVPNTHMMFSDPVGFQHLIQEVEYTSAMTESTSAEIDPVLGDCVLINPSVISRSDKQSLVARGYHQLTSGSFKAALSYFARAIASEKQATLSFCLQGVTFYKIGSYSNAEKSFSNAIRRKVDFHQAYFNRCLTRLHQRKESCARKDIEVAVKLDPSSDKYREVKGLLSRRFGDFTAALGDYMKLRRHHHHCSTTSVDTKALRLDLARGTDVYETIFRVGPELSTAAETLPEKRTKKMLETIQVRLSEIPIFDSFSKEVLNSIAAVLQFTCVESGSAFNYKDPSSSSSSSPPALYLMLDGTLAGRRGIGDSCLITVLRLRRDDAFGALGTSLPKQLEMLIAEDKSTIAWLSVVDYEAIVKPIWLSKRKALYEFLSRLGIFKSLNTHDISHLTSLVSTKTYLKDTKIIRQGHLVDKLYLLQTGICSAYQRRQKHSQKKKVIASSAHHVTRLRPLHHRVNGTMQEQPRGNKEEVKSSPAAQLRKPILNLWTLKSTDDHVNESTSMVVGTLMAPDVFGESAIYGDDGSHSKTTIVAETFVQVVEVPWSEVQSLDRDKKVFEAIVENSPQYGSQRELLAALDKKKSWDRHKTKEILKTSKARWPISQERVVRLSGGKSVVIAKGGGGSR